eukprot:200569-Rhodomonas_salina.1
MPCLELLLPQQLVVNGWMPVTPHALSQLALPNTSSQGPLTQPIRSAYPSPTVCLPQSVSAKT